jgi:hypothetical protein
MKFQMKYEVPDLGPPIRPHSWLPGLEKAVIDNEKKAL